MKDGILVIDKPVGITSHDVVQKLRKKFNTKKVGHAGTLDPFATGILVIGINKGTRMLEYIQADKKTYFVKAKLGIVTDSFDCDGEVKETFEVTQQHLEKLKDTVFSFLGNYKQVPPAYSAKKYQGKRLYDYAREGNIISLPPKEVTISEIDNFKINGSEFEFTVEVSSGTYIRSLIMDIGYALGCGAYCLELRRIKSGLFDISQAINLADVEEDSIVECDKALNFPSISVFNGSRVLDGIQIYKRDIKSYSDFKIKEFIKIYDENDKFIGIGITERNASFLETLLKDEERNDRIVKLEKILR